MLLRPVPAPALPFAPAVGYERRYQDELNNILRLYFNRISENLNLITNSNGGQYVDCPNGLFFNTADQTFLATGTAYPVDFDQTYLSHGVQLRGTSTSEIEVLVSGVYNFQYTGQVISTNSSPKTIYLWIARNGTDIGFSTRANTLAANGEYMEANWAFNIDLAAGEYIELRASVTDTAMELHADPATPPYPGIPSSVLTVNFIAPLPDPRPAPP
jgi:hypothetical protein